MEALLLQIGTSVSGILLKLWLQDAVANQLQRPTLTELVEKAGNGPRQRRALKREFERIADEITARLEPLIQIEFANVSRNEREAAALLLQKVLVESQISDELLFATDLDPFDLETELKRSHPHAAEAAGLSQGAASLYELMLREVSAYIVEIRVTLPDFNSQASREILARETELIKLVQTVLERLPDELTTSATDDAGVFEGRYRRAIASKLDHLELFGVTTSEWTQRYSLSIAYLTLTASAAAGDESKETDRIPPSPHQEIKGGKRERAKDDKDERAYLPVDRALSSRPRALIRGEAGSGKTTLLQWLAVTSARRELGSTPLELEDAVPFFIQLRQYVDSPLPRVDDFIAGVNQHLADIAPEGWSQEQLESGRGLVLIDGVDELPEDQRNAARAWLLDLIEVYPNSRFIVTSRPPAVEDNWLGDQDFAEVLLEPMDLPAIRSFIDHWHEAAGKEITDEEAARDLTELREELKELVGEARPIRNLASSPLLCAMLCALNRDRRAKLPSDRIELYRIALEMLLERRDVERNVRADEVEVGLREKEILLRHFAFWLLTNGQSDAKRSDLEALLEARLEGMSRVSASAHAVVEHLLVRSGLLRQPIEGRVDFIHRTFQEYLGAKEAIEQRSVGLLVDKAHLDQWQEVIVLAAGLSSLAGREQLIEGLISRSEEEPLNKHRLQLLAVACLETSPELSPELRNRLEGLLDDLIPPKNKTEAKAIASAGEVAVPLLGKGAANKAVTAAACVRALTLIGGESSLAQLANFGPDQRVTVARELLRAWPEFPTVEFAERVLANSRLDYGRLDVSSADQLSVAPALNQLTTLIYDGNAAQLPPDHASWQGVAHHPGLYRLVLRGLEGGPGIPELQDSKSLKVLHIQHAWDLSQVSGEHLPKLLKLNISNAQDLTSVEGLDLLDELEALQLSDCPQLGAIPRLPPSLRRIYLHGLLAPSFEPLSACPRLETVLLSQVGDGGDLSLLSGLDQLSELMIEESLVGDLDSVAHCRQLKSLQINAAPQLSSVDFVSELTNLTELGLHNLPVTHLGSLSDLEGMRHVALSDLPFVQSLPALGEKTTQLSLHNCDGVEDISSLARSPRIHWLSLRHCPKISDISSLGDLPDLHYLDLEGCTGIRDLSPLTHLSKLQWVDIRGCDPDLDTTSLRKRGVRVYGGEVIARPQTRLWSGWAWRREDYYD